MFNSLQVNDDGWKNVLFRRLESFLWVKRRRICLFISLCVSMFSCLVADNGEGGMVLWEQPSARGRLLARETAGNSSLILAAERTRRKDPSNRFNIYTGGWNISNYHYWAVSQYLNRRFSYLPGQATAFHELLAPTTCVLGANTCESMKFKCLCCVQDVSGAVIILALAFDWSLLCCFFWSIWLIQT